MSPLTLRRCCTALKSHGLEDRTMPSSTTFVTSLYTNLLHRTPSLSETAYWVAQLDSVVRWPRVVTGFLHSPDNDSAISFCLATNFSFDLTFPE